MSDLTVTVHDTVAELKPAEWNAVVSQQSRTGCLFERHEWLAAYESASDATPRYLQVRRDGTLVGVHPTFERSLSPVGLRFLGPARPGTNGAMIATAEDEVLDALLDGVADLTGGRTVGHLLKPGTGASLRYAQRLRQRGYVPTVRDCQFRVDLDRPWEGVVGDFSGKKRRNLRKADEAGVEGTTAHVTPDAVDAFADRHGEHMRRIDGTGVSRAFLQALRTHLGDRIVLFQSTLDGRWRGRYSPSVTASGPRYSYCSPRTIPTASNSSPRKQCIEPRSGGGSTTATGTATSGRRRRTSPTAPSCSRPNWGPTRSRRSAGSGSVRWSVE